MISPLVFALLAAELVQETPGSVTRQEFQRHQAAPTGFFQSICHLKVTRRNLRTGYFRKPVFNSTGFVYRDRYLITAAHNVHSNAGSVVLGADLSCGAADADAVRPDTSFGRNAIHVLDGYSFLRRIPARYERDIAVVRLRKPICRTPQAEIGPIEESEGNAVSVAGYPGEEGDQGRMNGKRLYFANGGLLSPDESYLLRHNVVTEEGNSGGPVWVQRDGRPVIVGVHVGMNGATRRFDPATVDEINRLIDNLEAAQPTPSGDRCARL